MGPLPLPLRAEDSNDVDRTGATADEFLSQARLALSFLYCSITLIPPPSLRPSTGAESRKMPLSFPSSRNKGRGEIYLPVPPFQRAFSLSIALSPPRKVEECNLEDWLNLFPRPSRR